MKDIDKKIIYLYSLGNSFNKISVETKKSKPYIRRILIESGIEVKNLKNTPEFYSTKCKYCGSTAVVRTSNGRTLKTCVVCYDKYREDSVNKRRQTTIKKYGKDNVAKVDDIKEKIKKTNIIKYGTENPVQNKDISKKIENTNIRRYGVKRPIQNKEIKEKIKNTNITKYGCENPLGNEDIRKKADETKYIKYGTCNTSQIDEIKESIKKTNNIKYGCDYSVQADSIKEKIKNTNILKYGVVSVQCNPEIAKKSLTTLRENYWDTFIKVLADKKIKPLFNKDYYINHNKVEVKSYICLRCGNTIETDKVNPHSIFCSCLKHRSSYEDEIVDWLNSVGKFNIIKNEKYFVNGKMKYEIDIFLPDYMIGIDFHGVYWHSEKYKDKKYHQNKSLFFKDQGIFLIQIFENEWILKNKIVKSIILSKLGLSNRIFARKCSVVEIPPKESKSFLNENHIQGSIGSKIRIGLKYKEEIVMMMSVGKNRFNRNLEYELLRLCSKCGVTVVGGFERLLKYIKQTYDIKIIVSFVDTRLFSGSGYKKVGFKEELLTAPNYFYFKDFDSNYTLHSRIQFQKHKLPKKLDNFNANISEHENMLNNGYLRIFDAGNIKMRLEF